MKRDFTLPIIPTVIQWFTVLLYSRPRLSGGLIPDQFITLGKMREIKKWRKQKKQNVAMSLSSTLCSVVAMETNTTRAETHFSLVTVAGREKKNQVKIDFCVFFFFSSSPIWEAVATASEFLRSRRHREHTWQKVYLWSATVTVHVWRFFKKKKIFCSIIWAEQWEQVELHSLSALVISDKCVSNSVQT